MNSSNKNTPRSINHYELVDQMESTVNILRSTSSILILSLNILDKESELYSVLEGVITLVEKEYHELIVIISSFSKRMNMYEENY